MNRLTLATAAYPSWQFIQHYCRTFIYPKASTDSYVLFNGRDRLYAWRFAIPLGCTMTFWINIWSRIWRPWKDESLWGYKKICDTWIWQTSFLLRYLELVAAIICTRTRFPVTWWDGKTHFSYLVIIRKPSTTSTFRLNLQSICGWKLEAWRIGHRSLIACWPDAFLSEPREDGVMLCPCLLVGWKFSIIFIPSR